MTDIVTTSMRPIQETLFSLQDATSPYEREPEAAKQVQEGVVNEVAQEILARDESIRVSPQNPAKIAASKILAELEDTSSLPRKELELARQILYESIAEIAKEVLASGKSFGLDHITLDLIQEKIDQKAQELKRKDEERSNEQLKSGVHGSRIKAFDITKSNAKYENANDLGISLKDQDLIAMHLVPTASFLSQKAAIDAFYEFAQREEKRRMHLKQAIELAYANKKPEDTWHFAEGSLMAHIARYMPAIMPQEEINRIYAQKKAMDSLETSLNETFAYVSPASGEDSIRPALDTGEKRTIQNVISPIVIPAIEAAAAAAAAIIGAQATKSKPTEKELKERQEVALFILSPPAVTIRKILNDIRYPKQNAN
jgi:hypothetical protein